MKISRFVSAAASAALVVALVAAIPAGASTHSTKAAKRYTAAHKVALHYKTRVNLGTLATQAATHPKVSKALTLRWARMRAKISGLHARTHTRAATPSPSISAPSPKLWSISGSTTSGFNGWSGVNANQSRAANGFDVEPPDQGLCMGNGNVIDIVNLAMQVYSTSGKAKYQAPVALNAFFGLDPSQFTSDPKCVYDPQTQRFYATALWSDVSSYSYVMLAVSDTSNPLGFWNIFYIETTDGNGSSYGHPGCPCLGDQPLLGFDANGVYISTNEFGLAGPTFNGTQIYAISKIYLYHDYNEYVSQYEPYCDGTAGDPWCALNDPTPGSTFGTLGGNNQIYSQQPITSANGASWKMNDGTMFFMGTADYNAFSDDLGGGVVLMALTGTDGLSGPGYPLGDISGAFVKTNTYGFPPLANQKSGPVPLADYLNTLASDEGPPPCAPSYVGPPAGTGCVEGQIETNDDRMNQTFLANGNIWGSWNTIVHNSGIADRSALKWVAVHPAFTNSCGNFSSPCVRGTLKHQNIIATKASLYYPSMVVAPNGHVFVTASLSGASYYPSAAYATNVPMTGTGTVHIFGAGKAPQDGFTEYYYPPGRWGDYSAAEMNTSGQVWFATEWIPGLVQVADGGFANWGTKVGSLMP